MTLRTRLVLLAASVVAFAAITIGFGAYVIAGSRLQTEVDRVADARIETMIRAVTEFRQTGRQPRVPDNDPFQQSGYDSVTQVLYGNGTIILLTGNHQLDISKQDLAIASAQQGKRRWNATIDGTKFRGTTAALPTVGAVMVAREISDIAAAQNSMRTWFLALGLIAVSFAILIAWWIAKATAKPIEDLAAATTDIALTQDTSRTINIASTGEIRKLGEGFNSMLAALDTSRRQQQQLVQDASHELRTPLTSLRANAELLSRHDLDDHTRYEILRDIQTEVDELSALAGELSALATDQRKEEELSEVAIDEVAESVAARAMRRTGRTVTVNAIEPATIEVRASQFDRALSNLVENALKFSPESTEVEIEINRYRIAVHDHGPGISDEDAPKVFDRFFRAVATRTQPGSGLGLAIVAQFAHDHGATTFIERGTDGGAIVGMVFPSDPSSWANPTLHQAK